MFKILNYVCLYLKEYLCYIMKNINSKSKYVEVEEQMIEVLLKEFEGILKKYISTFDVNIDKTSVLSMQEYTKDIEEKDPEKEINYFDVILSKGHISIEEIGEYIYLCLRSGRVNIRVTFNLNDYLENQKFNPYYELLTSEKEDNYSVIEGNFIYSYDLDTVKKRNSLNELKLGIIYPDNKYKLSRNKIQGFFEYAKDVNDDILNNRVKCKRKLIY